LLLVLAPSARAQAVGGLPSEAAFFGELGAIRAQVRTAVLAFPPVLQQAQGLSHDEAVNLVLADLGSAVPEAYARAALNDPRVHLISDIPDKFKAPGAASDYGAIQRRVLTDARVEAGAAFMREHKALLASVEAKYGVDAGTLAGLSGVETYWGRSAGTYPVFSALYTITRLVPGRSAWAARELAEYLKLCRQDGLDPQAQLGSYAGAFGFVQFMPSSFNRWAVDFDGDGRRRLDTWPDALGRASNYLAAAG
jgi:membrane-bound lytic murein transglycosylase B